MKKTWFIGFESYDVIFQKDLYKRELDLSNILCRLGNLLEVSYISENYTEEYQLYTYEKGQACKCVLCAFFTGYIKWQHSASEIGFCDF